MSTHDSRVTSLPEPGRGPLPVGDPLREQAALPHLCLAVLREEHSWCASSVQTASAVPRTAGPAQPIRRSRALHAPWHTFFQGGLEASSQSITALSSSIPAVCKRKEAESVGSALTPERLLPRR